MVALLDSVAVSRLAFDPANRSQLALTKMSTTQAAKRLRFTFVIIRLLCLETGRYLEKQGVGVRFSFGLVPFVGGFEGDARAKPIIKA